MSLRTVEISKTVGMGFEAFYDDQITNQSLAFLKTFKTSQFLNKIMYKFL